MTARIKDLKQGELFRLTDSETAPVWVRGYYERTERKYEAYKYEDCNHESFFKGDRVVYIGFTY